MKVATAVGAAVVVVVLLIGGAAQSVVKAIFGGGGTEPTKEAIADIPDDYLALYQGAASVCPGLDWSVIAGIGKIETNHGRSPLPGVHSGANYAGAGGPMQFLQSTFDGVIAQHDIPPGGSNPPSRYNPHDAIYAAAYNLCDNGAQKDIRQAIYAYNHADWYVNDVLAQAAKYGQSSIGTGDCKTIQAPNEATALAINFACGQLGLPYVWGGNGPSAGHAGFDCSGLTKAAYDAAGVSLPRTAQTQYNAGPLVPAGQPLLPGDLLFYGTPSNVHHVGLYLGAGQMVHAPDFGQSIKIAPYRWSGDDYLAASRPVADSRV